MIGHFRRRLKMPVRQVFSLTELVSEGRSQIHTTAAFYPPTESDAPWGTRFRVTPPTHPCEVMTAIPGRSDLPQRPLQQVPGSGSPGSPPARRFSAHTWDVQTSRPVYWFNCHHHRISAFGLLRKVSPSLNDASQASSI